MPSLIVRDSRNGRVKEIPLRKRRFTIGKSDWNDLVLPRETIAREHCVIFFRDDAFLVRDLSGDKPGTVLDGKKVEGDAPINDGARIEVGDFEILFKQERSRTKGGDVPEAEAKTSQATKSGTGKEDEDENDPQRKARRMCHQRLLEAKELKRIDFEKISDNEARERTERVVVAIIKEIEGENVLPEGIDKHLLLKEVLDEALGLGPLEDLLADDDVNEIMVNARSWSTPGTRSTSSARAWAWSSRTSASRPTTRSSTSSAASSRPSAVVSTSRRRSSTRA
jgi:pilus assembly protein CpaF